MRRCYINPISKKKQKQIEAEYPIQIQLCNRADGLWVQTSRYGGHCNGGICEICGNPPDWRRLRPHHTGIGADRETLSLEDKMLCGKCHSEKHGIEEV